MEALRSVSQRWRAGVLVIALAPDLLSPKPWSDIKAFGFDTCAIKREVSACFIFNSSL